METSNKVYSAPALIEYGTVGNLTGIFGSDMTQDQSFDPTGKVIATNPTGGSIDQCATGRPRANCL